MGLGLGLGLALARFGLTLTVTLTLTLTLTSQEASRSSSKRVVRLVTYSRTSGLMSPATGSATCLGRGLGLSHLPGARVRAQPPAWGEG